MKKQRQEAVNMLGKQTNNQGFFAVPAPGPVHVDGEFGDWDLSGQIESYANAETKDVFSVKTAAMWDAQSLYLAFDWRDPYPMESRFHPARDSGRGWMSDSVQLRVLADGHASWITLWDYAGERPVVQIVYLNRQGGQLAPRAGEGGELLFYKDTPGEIVLGPGVEMAYKKAADGKGFTQEVRLPWTLLFEGPYSPKAGDAIRLGLEFHFGSEGGGDRPIHSYSDNVRPGTGMRSFFWTNADNWGDLTLADAPLREKRVYLEEIREAEGIPLRCEVETGAKTFTIVLNGKDGQRVRNVAGGLPVEKYKVGEKNGKTTVEVYWDGLDESGRPVPPGEYVLAGVTAKGIEGYFESAFYNPGTPPWKTANTRGAWGADHTLIQRLAAAGDGMAVCCRFAEGGYGTFLLETTGERRFQKRWSEIRGTDAVAANARYIFTIPNDWSASGVELLRLNAADGSFAPFVRDGRELPMPYRLADLFGEKHPPAVTALAAASNLLLMRCGDGTIRSVDAESGTLKRVYPLGRAAQLSSSTAKSGIALDEGGNVSADAMTTDGRNVYYALKRRIYKLDLETGRQEETGFNAAQIPSALALDGAGNLYIADAGDAQQIIKCAPDGRELMRIGTPGGRAYGGKYDRHGLRTPIAVAVDAKGYIWAAEECHAPRRLSVWAPDGTFYHEFIGNCGYAGQGTVIHNQDGDKAFAEYVELRRSAASGQWEAENVMYDPDPRGGLAFPPGDTPFDSGSMFYSWASGEKREYFATLGWPNRPEFFLMMKKGERWIPAAGIATVASLLSLFGGEHGRQLVRLPEGEWAENDPADYVFWNDYNMDGYVTRDECVILPALKKSLDDGCALPVSNQCVRSAAPYEVCSSGMVSAEDLSFHLTRREKEGRRVPCLLRPTAFRADGVPVYLPEGVTPLRVDYQLVASAVSIPGKNLTAAFIQQEGKTYVAGLRKDDGKVFWKYLSPYHEVHGSHAAPISRPGLLIGCLKIAGYAEGCGDSDVLMVRGNMGEDYYLTTDGMYIDAFMQDSRLPGPAFPDNEAEMKKVSLARFPGRGEHFSGRLTRHDDGVVRCHGGLPACEAGNVIRIEGLEHVKHIAPVPFRLTPEEAAEIQRSVQDGAAQPQKKEALRAFPAKHPFAWENVPGYTIQKDGLPAKGMVCLAYDAENLYLRYTLSGIRWVNGGNEWRALFKTGDCVDFQCSPAANRRTAPAPGDFRVLIAPFKGENAVVLMRQVEERKAFDPAESYKYSSPVMDVRFDTVRLLREAQARVQKIKDGVRVEAALPWKALGITSPTQGTRLTGDAGFIVADQAGRANSARVYYYNEKTNLVNDQGGEARISPEEFGEIAF